MSTSKHPPPGRSIPPRDDLETDRDDSDSAEDGNVARDADATGAPTQTDRQRTNP